MEETVLYDVCNDYSLEKCEDQNKDLSAYRTRKMRKGILYIHKEYDELHYLRGPAGLDGQVVHK